MKVAHVTVYPPKGEKHVKGSGVASYSKNLVAHITGDAIDQTVVCNTIEDAPRTYTDDGVVVRRTFRRRPQFIISVHNELKKIDADVVHIQQELALYGGILTAYLLQWLVFLWRRRVVVTLHGVVDPDKITPRFVHENNSHLPVPIVKLAFRIIYTPLMRWARRIIVHEQYFKDILVRSYGISADKIDVVPHGVEQLETYEKTAARAKLDIGEEADVALFMGYATGYKGIDLLIEGFSEYAKRNPNAYLIIGAGKHPKLQSDETYLAEYDRLQQKAASLIPAAQYRWDGFIPEAEVALYYSASDVSVYPYTTALSSSGPMSFAIGFEKPFLVSSAFAAIFSQYPHLLFDQYAKDLALLLDYFFTHRNEYEQTSSHMKQERSWSKVGAKTQEVYQAALGVRG